MRVSLVYSLLLLSCLVVALVTAQELQGQEIEYAAATTTTITEHSFDTSQYGGSRDRDPPSFTHLPNNTVLISVNGESRIEIPADYAIISASVEMTNTSAPLTDQASVIRDVSDRTAIAMTRILEILKGTTNVTQIKTTHVQLSPMYRWDGGMQTLIGYRAINSISFRVDLSSASAVLDSIVRGGITTINYITYAASANRIAAARTRAIQDAIKDAQSQAKAMATTLPTTATPEIFKIDMMAASSPAPVSMPGAYMYSSGRAALMAPPQPIVGGNLEIVSYVKVRFMVKKESNPTSF